MEEARRGFTGGDKRENNSLKLANTIPSEADEDILNYWENKKKFEYFHVKKIWICQLKFLSVKQFSQMANTIPSEGDVDISKFKEK